MNSRILAAINSAIAEQVFPSIDNTFGRRIGENTTVVSHWSSGLQRKPEAKNTRKSKENRPKTGFKPSNQDHIVKKSSVDSQNSEQDYDKIRKGVNSQIQNYLFDVHT